MTTARALRGPFDYRLPEELSEGVDVGSMLVVPFGRREVLGVVVGLADSSEVAEEKLLAPLRALELGGGALDAACFPRLVNDGRAAVVDGSYRIAVGVLGICEPAVVASLLGDAAVALGVTRSPWK